jgi:hypothetical protein
VQQWQHNAEQIKTKLVTSISEQEITMKNTATIARERSEALDNVKVEISKVGVGAIAVTSTIIGCWAVACLVSGMISTGGPAGLVSSFISAIAG